MFVHLTRSVIKNQLTLFVHTYVCVTLCGIFNYIKIPSVYIDYNLYQIDHLGSVKVNIIYVNNFLNN